jgi:hypothetical protein
MRPPHLLLLSALLAVPVLADPGASWKGLRAGHAEADISPGREITPFGYDFRGQKTPPGNPGVHDPLRFRALALSDAAEPRKPVILASFDWCVIPDALAAKWRERIATHTGTTPERVILTATHTHSGPYPDAAADAATAAYLTDVEERICGAAARAVSNTYPVRASWQAAPLGLSYDRRVRAAEGIAMCWNPQVFEDRQPVPAADPTCSLLLLRQDNGPRQFALWSHGSHPVVLGRTSPWISADFPGRACALIGEYLPGSQAIFFMGASGHSQPWISTQEDPAKLEPVARAAASFVALLAEGTRPLDSAASLAVHHGSVETGAGKLDLTVIRTGGIRLIAVPVELFEELSLDLRRRSSEPVFLMTLANGWNGYLPHRAAFEEGGYEVEAALKQGYRPGDGEKLVDALLQLAGSQKNGNR